jgi:hypothetical protein
LIQAFGEDGLDGPVAGIGEFQSAAAGGFQPDRAIGFAQVEDPLDGAQVIENPIGEEVLDQGVASRPHLLGLL